MTDETVELTRTVRRFLDERGSEAVVRALMEDPRGYDPQMWARMANQLGLTALMIPEPFGGLGIDIAGAFGVFEEMGRALLPSPFLSTTALAAPALVGSGDDTAMGDYLPGIAEGTMIATLAVSEGRGGWHEAVVATRAEQDAGQWRLWGEKRYVTDAQNCHLILIAARTAEGIGLFAVESVSDHLEVVPEPTLDLTRKLATVRLDGTPARLLGTAGEGWQAVDYALRIAKVALAAEQVGGAQRVLEMGVDYAKTRFAFGRPIGSFQAVKHKLANTLVAVENARSAALAAARSVADAHPDTDMDVSVAKAYCSDAYLNASADNIQVHGGIGFTWEHPAHLYFKRAKSSQILFGSPAYHRDKIGKALGI